MTDNDLQTLLREHVSSSEPPFSLRPEDAIRRGRGRRTRLRLTLAGAGLAAAAAVGIVVATLPGTPTSSGGSEVSPLTQQALEQYDATKMPALLDEHVRRSVGSYLPLRKVDFTAHDDQLQALPRKRWPVAHSMQVQYNWKSGHRLRVWLGHSKSEAEGDKERACRDQSAWMLACDVTTLTDGTVVTSQVTAVVPETTGDDGMWIGLTKENLRTNLLPEWATGLRGEKGPLPLDRSKLFFVRSVEAVHSETFLTNAAEYVQAQSYDAARFAVPVPVLTEVVTDPALVIPKP